MEEKGFNPDYTRKCLDVNMHNSVTTTYFLLLKRYLMEGNQLKADISCNEFDNELIDQI
jgi:5'-AMP-activated protein kinase catalytic alpha subunit